MSSPFSPEVSDRICKHMNEDHADAIALYAKVFGGTADAIAAEMLKIDAQGMDLLVQTDGQTDGQSKPIRINFDHTLADSEDAHQTLIAMVKQARARG
jgi:putative heme iron utilization protein